MKTRDQYRLADTTLIEPLVNKWYAWSHLISPLTAGFHTLNYQCHIMESYAVDPLSHVQASRDPSLKGGPFIDVPISRAGEIHSLLDGTRLRLDKNLQLTKAVVGFYDLLVEEAKGQTIETYYQKLPPGLRGYVELVYDYYNRPTLRILESLLYESPYYNDTIQSFRLSRLESDESRPFYMCTPRLEERDQIDWPIPLGSDKADLLFRLESEPQPLGYIRELLGLDLAEEAILYHLFSKTPPPPREVLDSSSLRLRYFGHATVLIEWNGISILTDPYISVHPYQKGVERFSYNDLPEKIDFALITHNHHDHLVLETLLRLRNRISCLVVPKSHGLLYGDICLKLMAKKLGFTNCLEIDALETLDFPGGEIIGVPFLGEHSDIAHSKIGYVIRIGDERILFAADSACLDETLYRNIRRIIGPVQTVFLGMECVGAPLTWHCGSLLPRPPDHNHNQGRRSHGSDSAGGLRILEALEAKRFYNYAMGIEPWLEFLLGLGLSEESTQIKESNDLLRKARGRGFLEAERLFSKRDIYLPSVASHKTIYRAENQHAENANDPNQTTSASLPIWYLTVSDTESLCCKSTLVAHVAGDIDEISLKESLARTIANHEILGSALSSLDGTFARRSAYRICDKVDVADLTATAQGDNGVAPYSSIVAEQSREFDLEKGPLLRACLVKVTQNSRYIVLTGHRLVCDDSALHLLIAEAAQAYAETVADDGMQRQKDNSRPSSGSNALSGEPQKICTLACESPSEWDEEVAASSLTELPIYATHTSQPVFISEAILKPLSELSASAGCELSIVLLAAFKVLINSSGLGEEISVKTIIESASHNSKDCLIAPLASIVLVTTDVSGNPCFSELIDRVRRVVARSIEQQKVTRDDDLHNLRLRLNHDSGRSYPVFIHKRKFSGNLLPRGGKWSYLDALPATMSDSLVISLNQGAQDLSGALFWNKQSVDPLPADNLNDKYQMILQEAALNPNKRLVELRRLFETADYLRHAQAADFDKQFNFCT